MKFSFANTDDEIEIKRLLAGSELLHEDIATDQFKHFRLVRDGPRLVAVVGLEIRGHSALLRSLAVDADYRNRKIASRLVGEIEDYARSIAVDTLYLLTMTAENFFAKCGYRQTVRGSAPAEIQETTEFQNLCPASATCMVKYIGTD
jgi:amino-acid N-acetyltransferase